VPKYILLKKACLIILLVILGSSSFCQSQLGIKIGYNRLKIIQTDKDYHPSTIEYYRNSIPVSIYFCTRAPRWDNFCIELEYLNRSYSMTEYWGGLGAGGSAHYRIDAYYLNILVEPQFTFGKKIKFLLFPGLYLGTPVYSEISGTKHEFYSGQYSKNDTLSGSAKGNLSTLEFGALAGFGIEVPVGKGLVLTANYMFTINLIATPSEWGDNSYRFMQNKIELGLAYRFEGKKNNKAEDK
jgi:hypothetical protein